MLEKQRQGKKKWIVNSTSWVNTIQKFIFEFMYILAAYSSS